MRISYLLLVISAIIIISSCNYLERIDKKVGTPKISRSINEAIDLGVFVKEYKVGCIDSSIIRNVEFNRIWIEKCWKYQIDDSGKIIIHIEEGYNLIVDIERNNNNFVGMISLRDGMNHELLLQNNFFVRYYSFVPDQTELFLVEKKGRTYDDIKYVGKIKFISE